MLQGWGVSCPGQVYLAPHLGIMFIFFLMLISLVFKFSVHEVVAFIIINQIELFSLSFGLIPLVAGGGGGASCPGWFIFPPPGYYV